MTTWKKHLLLALGALAMFAGGTAVGRYTLPSRVEYVREVKEIHHKEQVIQQQVDIDELMKRVTAVVQKNNVVTERERIIEKDGKIIEREKIADLSETNTRIEENTQTFTSLRSEMKLLEETLKLDRESRVTTYEKPKHRFGVLAGYEFGRLFGRHDTYNLVPVRGLVAQIQYERRLAGPMWVVGWAQSTLTGGAGLKLEW